MILIENSRDVVELLDSINPAPGSHDNINNLLRFVVTMLSIVL